MLVIVGPQFALGEWARLSLPAGLALLLALLQLPCLGPAYLIALLALLLVRTAALCLCCRVL